MTGTRGVDMPLRDRWWTKPVGLAIISATITLALGVSALVVGLNIDPSDDANYIVTAAALMATALNVLFTLWLLRTAQKQLTVLSKQVVDQEESSSNQLRQLRVSHDAERDEARQQLESLHEQLQLARNSHLAERDESAASLRVSRESVDEALKTRLDQLAPRVSLAVKRVWLVMKHRMGDGEIETTKTLPNLHDLLGVAGYWFEYVVDLELHNWSSEPAVATLPSPWTDPRSELLFPGKPWALRHTFTVSTSNLRQVAETGIVMNDRQPEWVFPVVVDDLGHQVHDYHVWRIRPMPFKIEQERIIENKDALRGYQTYGVRERRYQFLDQRTVEAGGTLDGPRL